MIINKQLLPFIFGLLLALIYGSPTEASEGEKIIIRGSDNYPPFEFINEAGQPEGFNVELMHALMQELGYSYDLKLENWDQTISNIQQGKTDVVLGMIYSPERAQTVRLSVPTCVINRNFITRKSDNYHSMEDLQGKELIVEKGGWFHRYLQETKFPCTIIESNDIYQSLEMLNSGKHDAVLAGDLVAAYAMKKLNIKDLRIKEMGIEPKNYSIAVNQHRGDLLYQLNIGLQRLKTSGTYDQIYNKWFGIYESQENGRNILIIAAIFLGIAIWLGTFVWLLHRQVGKATRMLKYAQQEMGMAIEAGKLSAWSYTINTRIVTILHGETLRSPGQTIDDIYKDIHPDDVSLVQAEFEALSKKEKLESNIAFRICDNGENSYRYIETKMLYVEGTKELPKRIVGTLKDVTERISTQQKLEEYRLKSELIIKVNDISLLQYDTTQREFIRISEGDIGKGHSTCSAEEYLSLVHPEDVPTAMRFIAALNTAEEIRIDAEFRIISEESTYNWYSITGSAYKFDEKGKITSYIGLRRNNNQWKAINKDLILLREKAEAANRLKSAFLANMSHEIRTPLNAIVGFSELVMETSDGEERNAYIEIVKTNNELLLKLINDVLDLSRIESGYVNFSFITFDFSAYFQELCTSLEIKNTPCVKLQYNNQPESLRICSDQKCISQVIINLVTNAFKFTKKGSITLDYSYENDGIKVNVIDTGIGIAQENLSRIFERFEKIDDFAQGTGLGLSICKTIVEALQGKIGVESELGVGSTFWFWIPCTLDMNGREVEFETPSHLPQTPIKEAILLEESGIPLKLLPDDKRTLLIADDIDNNFTVISAAVKGKYNVIHAKNGIEAINMAYQYKPDIILMDMKMPIMGGLEATKEIRRFNPHVPIIALTAYVFDTNKQDALGAGCNEFLTKPVKRDVLIEILNQC